MWRWSSDGVESFSDVPDARLRSGAESLSISEVRFVSLGARCAAYSSSVMGPGRVSLDGIRRSAKRKACFDDGVKSMSAT
jgi:hypothetical protein